MPSKLLAVADAARERVVEILTARYRVLSIDTEVLVTWFADRFNAEETTGLKVYIWPVGEASAPLAQGGDRGSQPRLYKLAVTFVERIPSDVRLPEKKDDWVRERVAMALSIRDDFDSPFDYSLPGLDPADVPLVPTDVGEMDTADLEYLIRAGVWTAGFDVSIREDAT
jgi:hypothetical protein